MIQDIALWIKQIPKEAGFVPVKLYVLFQIMNMANFAFTCLMSSSQYWESTGI